MKIKKLLDDKIMLDWCDFNKQIEVGGIIVLERNIRDIRGNEGTVEMIGPDVKHVAVGDYIHYAVGPMYLPIDTPDGKKIIIPETDVLFILEKEEE